MDVDQHARWAEHYKSVRNRIAAASLKKINVDSIKIEEVAPLFLDVIETPSQRILREVVQPVLDGTGYTIDDMRGEKKFRKVATVRWKLIKALTDCGWTTLKIGRFLNRDHSTIIYALRKVRENDNKQESGRPIHGRPHLSGNS